MSSSFFHEGFVTDLIFPHQSLPEDIMSGYQERLLAYGAGLTGNQKQCYVKSMAMSDLILLIYGKYFPVRNILDVEPVAQAIAANKIFPFFFITDGKIVGSTAIIPDQIGGAEFGRTVVHRDYWGQGIGDLLLNARFTFARLYAEELKINWFFSHVRAANKRIFEIWMRSPHYLFPVGIAPYYHLDVTEFLVIFVRYFKRIEMVQHVDCAARLRPLVQAVCSQFKNVEIQWTGGTNKTVSNPSDYFGYFTKAYISDDSFDLVKILSHQNEYVEVWCPVNIVGASEYQQELLRAGFIPNAFYPAFNGYPGYLSFGRLEAELPIRSAHFPDGFDQTQVGLEIMGSHAQFCENRVVHNDDPFV
uniref:N-acetyltransferase domain-containing protein n=2 Tax=Candidatus Komeiliibacteriota TaxID=1817908 RepID=A0A2M7RF69_9BACT|nr:MAG: hypothetical protein COY67_00275 [Candidatus Komeilibacteria bacterium CG_4_10_14_0_8_um_filter_37_78]